MPDPSRQTPVQTTRTVVPYRYLYHYNDVLSANCTSLDIPCLMTSFSVLLTYDSGMPPVTVPDNSPKLLTIQSTNPTAFMPVLKTKPR